MGQEIAKLLNCIHDGVGYDLPYADIRDAQLAALQERFEERVSKIRIVSLRAKEANLTRIGRLEDLVPLLLPHTAYKSYPESVLSDGRWGALTKWLGTLSTYPLESVQLEAIADIDDWILRLEKAGHYVTSTSGTTGKAAMLVSSRRDIDWASVDLMGGYSWATGVKPARDRRVFGLSPMPQTAKNRLSGEATLRAYGIPGSELFNYPVPQITIGSITKMIALRKAIAAGTAKPSEVTDFETTAAARQEAIDNAVDLCADALIDARNDKLSISGTWASIFKISEEIRRRGYGRSDFNPSNMIFTAGGLKGAHLPDDYQSFVYDTFNIGSSHVYNMYGMQELGTGMPRCQKGGRYHLPPWLICLPLDKHGEELLPITTTEIEGRAAFFDLSIDGRWGGLISGDRIQIDFAPCKCGARSPSIRDEIMRYSDIEGDDKIACSGTIDAYVRGIG